MSKLVFHSDTRQRKWRFTAKHFAHPAKMVLPLQLWLVEHYTKPGDVILDPMAGSGTVLVACSLGRHVIAVELEDKFCLMMAGGDCDGYKCVDCQEREEWQSIDSEEQFLEMADKKLPENKMLEKAFQQFGWGYTLRLVLHKFPKPVPHKIKGNWPRVQEVGPEMGYSMGTAQILQGDARNLTGILVDKCIFSPPYVSGGHHPDQTGAWGGQAQALTKEQANYGNTEGQIGRLPYGEIDKIITSPPYAETDVSQTHMTSNKRGDPSNPNYRPSWKQKLAEGYAETKRPYSEDKENIGNLPYSSIDASPRGRNRPAEIVKLQSMGYNKKLESADQCAQDFAYSDNPYNIGNLKSDSYLSVMLQVYQQCYSVLKDNGLMVLVTKNFIRDKQEVRLDLDTVRLCEQAGFNLLERHYRTLIQQSFWRTIYKRKYPSVPEIGKEDILVFTREGNVYG